MLYDLVVRVCRTAFDAVFGDYIEQQLTLLFRTDAFRSGGSDDDDDARHKL